MYESYFRLSHRPFAATPLADHFLPIGPPEQARQTLVRCIERAEGPGLVIGPAGTGKSLLCQTLARHFQGRFQTAYLAGARLATRRALLQNILFELKLPYRDMDEAELRLSLVDRLGDPTTGKEGLLLLVDEAHGLPLRLLEEVRMLTNVVREGNARVRLVLAGGMALEERLASPKLESFHQRIAARCYLQSFTRDETIQYVQEQIRRAGGDPARLLTPEAQSAVHTATDGIPRLINQLCDHALLLAALGGQARLDAAGIDEAWADLQQLPVPLSEPAHRSAASGAAGIVEFGQLADEPAAGGATAGAPTHQRRAEAALAAIDRGIESLSADEPAAGVISGTAADDFSPVCFTGTEVELIFHEAHDPFGGEWDEEEVVIDRYATLDDAALKNRLSVTSDEAKALGSAVSQAGKQVDEPTAAESLRATIVAADFHPASDPLLPEGPSLKERVRKAAVSLRSIGTDDRDMIIVEEDPQPAPPTTPKPRRPEYRQLFSKLRSS